MLKDAEKFFNVFSNLPEGERKKPIVIIGGEPISWSMAYAHIDSESEKGKKILNILVRVGLI